MNGFVRSAGFITAVALLSTFGQHEIARTEGTSITASPSSR